MFRTSTRGRTCCTCTCVQRSYFLGPPCLGIATGARAWIVKAVVHVQEEVTFVTVRVGAWKFAVVVALQRSRFAEKVVLFGKRRRVVQAPRADMVLGIWPPPNHHAIPRATGVLLVLHLPANRQALLGVYELTSGGAGQAILASVVVESLLALGYIGILFTERRGVVGG